MGFRSSDIHPGERVQALACEDAEVLISRQLDGHLSPRDVPSLEAHLDVCEACRVQREMWRSNDQHLHDAMTELWSAPQFTRISSHASWRRRWVWVPLGAVAAQVLALLGLVAYLVLFTPKAQAPQPTAATSPVRSPVAASLSQPAPRPGPAAPAIQSARMAPEAAQSSQVTPHDVRAEQAGMDARTPPPAPLITEPIRTLPTKLAQTPERKPALEEHVSAILLQPPPKLLVPNVYAEFTLDGESAAGRITLLGDVFAGKAVLRLVDTRGVLTEVAQADVDAVLPAPQRAVARRFLAACLRPEMRTRFAEALRRADLRR